MDDGVGVLGREDFVDDGGVANVAVDEAVTRMEFDRGEVFQVAGVGEFIQIDDGVLG